MKTVIRIGKTVKPIEETELDEIVGMEVDTKVELIQALIPLGLLYVQKALQDEVKRLAGPRHSRQTGLPGHARWGRQRGSVYLLDQKLPVKVPRVRDTLRGKEVPLATYRGLQAPRRADEGLLFRVLQGLSCRSYETAAEAIPETFGLSPSTVSRRFVRASARRLQTMLERDLSAFDFVALVLDGKGFGKGHEMLTALGIMSRGIQFSPFVGIENSPTPPG